MFVGWFGGFFCSFLFFCEIVEYGSCLLKLVVCFCVLFGVLGILFVLVFWLFFVFGFVSLLLGDILCVVLCLVGLLFDGMGLV